MDKTAYKVVTDRLKREITDLECQVGNLKTELMQPELKKAIKNLKFCPYINGKCNPDCVRFVSARIIGVASVTPFIEANQCSRHYG